MCLLPGPAQTCLGPTHPSGLCLALGLSMAEGSRFGGLWVDRRCAAHVATCTCCWLMVWDGAGVGRGSTQPAGQGQGLGIGGVSLSDSNSRATGNSKFKLTFQAIKKVYLSR